MSVLIRRIHRWVFRLSMQVANVARPTQLELAVAGQAEFVICDQSIERTFAWLVKRRSIRTRWCKKASNWLAFVQFACASILCDLAVFG
jgi:hypothetical protein